MSQVLVTRHPERIGRLVLTNCDTHENFPPGPFKGMVALAKLPGVLRALIAPLRIGAVARAAFKPFSKKPIPPDLIRSWVEPGLRDPGVKRDLKKVTVGMNQRYTLEAAEKLRASELPILLAWTPKDRVFPLKFAERLAGEVPNARIVEIPEAGTFVPFDQPQRVADEIATFAGDG
jgi:pimeloyl-ACP methyl ester carboxylesterase